MYFFFFNDTATTEIYTLSLHDALPICGDRVERGEDRRDAHVAELAREPVQQVRRGGAHADEHERSGVRQPHPSHGAHSERDQPAADNAGQPHAPDRHRSEEHTSELQSRQYLVCRLLLEKKPHNACRPSQHHAPISTAACLSHPRNPPPGSTT